MLDPEIAKLHERIAALEGAVRQDAENGAALALTELSAALEQLTAASEEVAAKHDELAAERGRYDRLFDVATVPFVFTTPSGKIIRANALARELFGVDERFLQGKLMIVFVAAPDRRLFRSLIGAGLTEPRRVDLRISGRTVERDVSVVVTSDPFDGTLLWQLGDARADPAAPRDAPARPAGDELHAPREVLREVLDRLQQGVVGLDGELRIEVANRAAKRLVGALLRRGDLLPEPWPGQVGLRSLVAQAMASNDEIVREVAVGETLVSVSIQPSGRRMRRAVILLTDLTDRQRSERVEREFVANASHELRTPLSTIAGAVEILQSGAKEVPEVRDRFLKHVEREVDRLSRLVSSLLTIARAQARHELPQLAPVLVRPMLEDVAARLEPAEGVAVVVSCAPTLAAVAESDLLLEIVENLARNAAGHTTSGRIVLGARSSRGAVVIEVRDTGPGVPQEQLTHLFERFYRDPYRSGDGFGLGLAIVREAATALGGSVELESKEGAGTTVRVTLPRAAEAAA